MTIQLEIDPITPTIGAEIKGVDLAQPQSRETLDAIYQALIDHLVIFFRDQSLPPAAHVAFAESFGDLGAPHPIYPHVDGYPRITKLENDGERPPDTAEWHTDLTFKPTAPFSAVLWANKVPPTGGDTLWSSLYAPYDDLSAELKQQLSKLNAIHDMGSFRNFFAAMENPEAQLGEAFGRIGQAIHPMIRTHPVSQRKFLFVNQSFTKHIVGMSARASDRLLQYLFDHLDQPEYQVRFRWQDKSVAMWDNRVTQHYAVADYLPRYRCMHRITVVNDRRANGG